MAAAEEQPEGLVYREEFISSAEERQLLDELAALDFKPVTMRGQTARRTVRPADIRKPQRPAETPAPTA